MNVLDISVVLW